jgi:KamA family protein
MQCISAIDNCLWSIRAQAEDKPLHALLGGARPKPVVVLHVNHANEIDASVRHACARLGRSGAVLLNQAVLLRGVNDDPEILARLSEALFEAGVLPYYLHLLDRVQGAAHFDVPEAAAQSLYAALQARLPGYLVPRLVREVAGAEHKLRV